MSATEAWAVGNFGSIYHTTDAGQTWTPRDSGTRSPLFAVDFADATRGWAVGKSALVIHTVDGGQTWKRQKSAIPSEKHLFSVQAIDANTVWAVGDWGAIAVTHDGGETWEDRSLGTVIVPIEEAGAGTGKRFSADVILYAVSFPDAQHGFIAGEFGTLLATADGGATWEKRDVGTEKTLFGVRFATAERGWAVGIDGLLLHTEDAGRHWEVQRGEVRAEALETLGFRETIKNPGLYDVAVAGQHGVVVGDTGIVLTSADGGASWTRHELPGKQRLVWMRSVSLAPGAHGFVVGASGFSAAIDDDHVVPRGETSAGGAPP
jgi:photosystem II stability/assembly factor-like uncharacterized protein